jgi:hypothetical protein
MWQLISFLAVRHAAANNAWGVKAEQWVDRMLL